MLLGFFLNFGPYMLALIAGLFLTVRRRRTTPPPGRRTRFALTVGAALAFLVAFLPAILDLVGLITGATIPSWKFALRDTPFEFALPLLSGSVAVALWLTIPRPTAATELTAELAPRTMFSFSRRSLLVLVAVLAAAAAALACATGPMSVPDQFGRYTMYQADTGVGQFGVTIYGWYFSIPALASLLVLIALATLALRRIAKPPLAEQRDPDIAHRRFASEMVLAQVTAAICLHLSLVCRSLSATAGVNGFFAVGGKQAMFWTPFAALGPTLFALGLVLQLFSLIIWATLLWRGIIPAAPSRTVEVSAASGPVTATPDGTVSTTRGVE